jgi:hypothetical protein
LFHPAAPVEELVRSLSAWEQVWEGIRDNHEQNLNPTNKPLAVAATFQLAINRAERAEAELAFKAALVHELLPYQERAVKAEAERDQWKESWQMEKNCRTEAEIECRKAWAERDALRELLVEARKVVPSCGWPELIARIDEALKERE